MKDSVTPESISPAASAPLANNHISVDCVVCGFDGEQLRVLLVNRNDVELGVEYSDFKLPGSLIYQDEDLDEAAERVLNELTGVKGIHLSQFKTFGSKHRTANIRDVHWLERAQKAHVERIVTVAYFAITKLDATLLRAASRSSAVWVPLNEIGQLAFDHNLIISEALRAIRREVEAHRPLLFELLPKKFTVAQLRLLNEIIYSKQLDVRNFHKKISQMPYIVPLEERQKGVAHRAARFFKFDKKIYNALR